MTSSCLREQGGVGGLRTEWGVPGWRGGRARQGGACRGGSCPIGRRTSGISRACSRRGLAPQADAPHLGLHSMAGRGCHGIGGSMTLSPPGAPPTTKSCPRLNNTIWGFGCIFTLVVLLLLLLPTIISPRGLSLFILLLLLLLLNKTKSCCLCYYCTVTVTIPVNHKE